VRLHIAFGGVTPGTEAGAFPDTGRGGDKAHDAHVSLPFLREDDNYDYIIIVTLSKKYNFYVAFALY